MNKQQHSEIKTIFNPSEFVEFISVLEGLKPAMRTACSVKKLNVVKKICQDLNLYLDFTEYGVKAEAFSGGIMHKCRFVKADAKDQKLPKFVYIGQDKTAVRLAKMFDIHDNRRMGYLLGFPKCCIDFFCKCRTKKNYDLILNIDTPKKFLYLPMLNYACRHFHYSLLSHFPCCWDCEASFEIAENRLHVLQKYDPDLAAEMMDCLQTDVLYTDQVIVALKNAKWRNGDLWLTKTEHRIVGIAQADFLHVEGGIVTFFGQGHVLFQTNKVGWLPFQSQEQLPGLTI